MGTDWEDLMLGLTQSVFYHVWQRAWNNVPDFVSTQERSRSSHGGRISHSPAKAMGQREP